MEIRTDASHGVSTGPGTRQVLDPRKLSPKLQGRERKCTRLRGPPGACRVSRTKLAPHRGAGQLFQPLGPHPGTLNGAAHLPPPCTPRPPPLAGQPKPQHRLPDPETTEKGHVCAWQRGAEETPGGRWMARTLTAQDRPGWCGLHHEQASPGRREPWRAGPEHEDTLGFL